MRATRGYRGEPVVALGIILGGWIAVRAVMWDAWPPPSHGTPVAVSRTPARMPVKPPMPVAEAVAPVVGTDYVEAMPMHHARQRPDAPGVAPLLSTVRTSPAFSSRLSVSHQLLWMAAVSRMPLPAVVKASAAPFHPLGREPARPDRRWSADGWLMLRGGGASLAGGPAPATYGASQAGAVLRYRLVPRSDHRPAAYLRATAALNGSGERAVALGLSARPIAALPVVAAAELRATRTPHGTRLRPAAMAVTEIAPIPLPLGARAEAYAQAGYVGGRAATAFADGQVRVDREVARLGGAPLRAGGGAWGGAQKGAARLDVGPTATIGLTGDGGAVARLGLDWRFRAAGNAAPASGPALTLSAGF